MPEMRMLYHKQSPGGKMMSLTPALEATLTRDGWCRTLAQAKAVPEYVPPLKTTGGRTKPRPASNVKFKQKPPPASDHEVSEEEEYAASLEAVGELEEPDEVDEPNKVMYEDSKWSKRVFNRRKK